MAPGGRESFLRLEQATLDAQRVSKAFPCLCLQILESLRAACGAWRTDLGRDACQMNKMVHSRGVFIADGVAMLDEISYHLRMPEAVTASHLDLLRGRTLEQRGEQVIDRFFQWRFRSEKC